LAETVRSLQSSLDDKMKSLKKVIDEKLRLNEEVSDLRESNKRLSIAASSMPMTAPGSPLRRQTSAGDDDHDFSDTASISGKSTSAARSLATNPSSSKVKKGRALEEDFKILTNDLRTAQHTILDLEEQLKTKEKVIADQRQVAEQKSMIFESEVRVLESSKAKAVFQLRVLDEEHRRLTRDNETLSEEKRRATLEAQGYKKQYEETAASLADAEKRAEMLGADCETLQYDLKEKTAACEALAARLVDMKKQLANVSVQLASFAVRKIHRLLPSTEAQLIVQEKPSGGILVDVFAFGRHHVEDMGTVVEVRAHRDKITILYSHREPDLLEADNCEDIVKCLQGLMMKASS
jgi:DNA repair exonuclease SbcCD ATPase subunit